MGLTLPVALKMPPIRIGRQTISAPLRATISGSARQAIWLKGLPTSKKNSTCFICVVLER